MPLVPMALPMVTLVELERYLTTIFTFGKNHECPQCLLYGHTGKRQQWSVLEMAQSERTSHSENQGGKKTKYM